MEQIPLGMTGSIESDGRTPALDRTSREATLSRSFRQRVETAIEIEEKNRRLIFNDESEPGVRISSGAPFKSSAYRKSSFEKTKLKWVSKGFLPSEILVKQARCVA
jgi:hypothetical protein